MKKNNTSLKKFTKETLKSFIKGGSPTSKTHNGLCNPNFTVVCTSQNPDNTTCEIVGPTCNTCNSDNNCSTKYTK